MPSYLKRLSWVAPLLTLFASSVQAGPISAIYAFGDSLSDVGNAYVATLHTQPGPPYANGQFSNGNVWVQDLATDLGLATLTPSLLGGTDFAVGGAETGITPLNGATAGDLEGNPLSQLTAFQAANPTGANPNGLYTIWIGSDDMRTLGAYLAVHPTSPIASADIAAAIGNIDSTISTLAGDGAKNFLIVTVPDLGKTPEAIATGSVAGASALSLDFDAGLESSLGVLSTADPLLNLKVLDTYSLIDGIVADPSKFGLTDATDPCLVGAMNYAGGTACANPNQYLFWDDIHPTAAGHTIIADAALATIVPEPATLTLLGAGALAVFVMRRRSQAAPKI